MHHVVVPFEIKELTDTGEFTGEAAVYGNLDAYHEIIDPGASAEKLQEAGGLSLLLADHDVRADSRIGIAYLSDTPNAVEMRGVLNMDDENPQINYLARKVYSDLKFYKKHGYQLGLSIGFFTLKDMIVKGVRHLLEIDIKEVSVVSFPANSLARVETVKQYPTQRSVDVEGKAEDFGAILDRITLFRRWDQMITALSASCDSLLFDSSMDRTAKAAQMDENLNQFHGVMLTWFDDVLTYYEPSDPSGQILSLQDFKTKLQELPQLSHHERLDVLGALEAKLIDLNEVKGQEPEARPVPIDDLSEMEACLASMKAFVGSLG